MKFGTNVAFIFLIYATAGHVGAAAGIINDRQLQFSDNHNIAIASRISRSERRTQNLPSPLSLPSINILRGGGAINASTLSDSSNNIDHASEQRNKLKSRTLNALHLTSFLAVASVAMVMFSPLPSLTLHLSEVMDSSKTSQSPQARAIQILSLLSAIAASIELFLSPMIGTLIDVFGRKKPAIILYTLISFGNLGVVINPGVISICASRIVNTIVGGFLVIVANSVIADTCSQPPQQKKGNSISNSSSSNDQMGSVLGRQAAVVALGFLCGSVAGGRLTEFGDERTAYVAALIFSVLATLNVAFRMMDSLEFTRMDNGVGSTGEAALGEAKPTDLGTVATTLRKKFFEAPLSSVQLLIHYGSHMRTLALLMLLQSAPAFMGDVFQMFAKNEWGLLPKDFSTLIALFGVLGIVSNITLPLIVQSFGLRSFSLFAIFSSILFPLTTLLTDSYRPVLIAGCIGLYGAAQKVGTITAMTSLANEQGIPQGQLQGEKASMLALLKVGCPMLYSFLYLMGKSWSSNGQDNQGLGMIASKIGTKLPFVLNVMLSLCAFAVTWQNV